MSLYPKFSQLPLEDLIARFQDPSTDGEEHDVNYFTELAIQIAKRGRAGIDFLLNAMDHADHADIDRIRGIIFALTDSTVDHDDFHKRLTAYIHDERSMIVAEAIDSLTQLKDERSLERVLPLRGHPSPYVRASVLRYITRLYPERALPMLISALKDPHFVVRESAADELGELGATDAISYLQPLLADPHPHVRQAAQTAIENIESATND